MKHADHSIADEETTAAALPVPPTPERRRGSAWLVLAATLLTAVVVVAGTLVALTKTVTISVDGEDRSVTTLAGSVSGALTAAKLSVGEHDTLAPDLGQSVANGSTIVLNRGRKMILTIDGKDVEVWTTARTVEAALAEIGRNPADYQLSADRSRAIPVTGIEVTADTLHTITVNDRGTTKVGSTVSTTVAEFLAANGVVLGPNDRVSQGLDTELTADSALTVITLPTVTVTDGAGAPIPVVSDQATVADVLAGAGITVGAQDVVSVPLDTPLAEGLQVAITRVSSSQVTETVAIAQPADETVKDASLASGTRKVTQVGRAGEQAVVYDVVLTNGAESSRTEVSRTVTVEALATVTHVGTKVAVTPATPTVPVVPAQPATPPPADDDSGEPAADPEPEQAPTPPPASGSIEYVGNQVFFNDFEFGVNWDGLAKCESGNNPRAINPSGKYTGLFQFDDRTWQGVGGSGRSYDASPEEQLMRAKLLFQSRGLQPWACAWAA